VNAPPAERGSGATAASAFRAAPDGPKAVDDSLASFLPRLPILPYLGRFGEWDEKPKSGHNGHFVMTFA
jgi:hypothetical protein